MRKVSLFSILLPLAAMLVTSGCSDDGNGITKYIIVATAGNGGTISPSGEVEVAEGADRTFTITPDAGWGIRDVEVDEVPVGARTSYVFENVSSNHTILATFEQGFSLTVSVEGNGSVTKNPDKAIYDEGDSVELTATADDGWSFVGWQGDVSGSSNPVTVVMDRSKDVTAVFAEGQQHVLSISIDGQGSVARDPDQAAYADGTVVTLTAAPQGDWVFDHWEGDATGTDNPVQVTMDGDKAVTAFFRPSVALLAVYVDGGGDVMVDPDYASYEYGTQVELTAVPDAGWVFDHWEGDASGSDNPLTISMTGNKIITAYFTQETFALDVTIDGAGSVTTDPDQTEFTFGTLVTLTAVPDAGMKFDRWEGDVTGTTNTVQLVIDGDKAVTAFFVVGQYTVETAVVGSGSITKNPDQASYAYGDDVTLTAVPDAGWEFDHWEGDLTGSTNPAAITVESDVSVTAHFTQVAFTLTITCDGDGTVVKDPDQANYTSGTIVTLTAVPGAGMIFHHWEGDLTGSTNPVQITIDSDKSLTAFFTALTILLVDDDGGSSHQGAYQAALDANGYTYDNWNVNSSGSPGQSDLMNYDLVIWFCSAEYQNTLTTANQAALAAYLDAGGRFFISAMELLQYGQTDFSRDYLHVAAYEQDANASSAVATDDEISSGLGTVALSYPFTDYTDGLTPDSLATASFENPGGDIIAIKAIDHNFRTVFFGFPFEAISNDTTAATIMANVVTWLLQ